MNEMPGGPTEEFDGSRLQEVPVGDSVIEASTKPPRRLGLSLLRWSGVLLGGLLVLIAFLSATGPGQRVFVDQVLSRIQGQLAGELRIEGVQSGTLFTGVTLTGVELDAEDGASVLRADSIRVRYSPLAWITSGPRVSSIIAWGLEVEISQLESEQVLNIQRVVRSATEIDEVDRGGESIPQPIRVGRITVREGLLRILTPASDESTGRMVPSSDGNGQLLHRSLEEIDLDLEDVILRPGNTDQLLEARLASLSMLNAVTPEPFRLEEAFGEIDYGRRGIRVRQGAFRFDKTLVRGEVRVGSWGESEAWAFFASLQTDGAGDLSDLTWLDDRIPNGLFRGGIRINTENGVNVVLEGFEVDLGGSSLQLDGGLSFTDVLTIDAMDMVMNPLGLEWLEPWLGMDIPLGGWLSGEAHFSGTAADLQINGRTTLVPTGYGGAATTTDFSGILHWGDNPGATDLEVRLDPVNYGLVEVVAPGLPLQGSGTLEFQLSGRALGGLRFALDASLEADSVPRSRALLRGALRRTETGEWIVDVQGDVSPLSLGLLAQTHPEFGLEGELTGSIRGVGRLRDLQVTGDFDAAGGRVGLGGVLDLTQPGAFYRFDIVGESVPLSSFFTKLPRQSEWTGALSIEGRGLQLDSMDAAVTLAWSRSRVGGLHVDTVMAHLTASAGILTVDSLNANLGGVSLSGDGRLGMAAPLDGEARLTFSTESLGGLRPLLLGDTVIAKDTLTLLETELLRFEGVDVDALPDTSDVRMHGAMSGSARLVGSVDALNVELEMDVSGAIYGRNSVDSAHVVFSADSLPSIFGDWDISTEAFGVEWQGRSLERAQVDAEMSDRRGDVSLSIVRRPGEELAAKAQFAFDSLGGRLDLEEATATLDALVYALAEPTRIAWEGASVSFDSTQITRLGDDPMHMVASGVLSREGQSDFRLDLRGLHLDRVIEVLEIDALAEGHMDLVLTVQGLSDDPVIAANFEVVEPRYAGIGFSTIKGRLDYRGLEGNIGIEALEGAHTVLRVAGSIPYDLSLEERDSRSVRLPMDLLIQADSLDMADALDYFGTFEDVAGLVSGLVRVRGTTEDPEPEGVIDVEAAAWSLGALGVRHSDVNGSLTFNPDKQVAVHLVTDATGRSEIDGTITLDPARDPVLDLGMNFNRFQAVQRLDIESMISGNLTVEGRFSRPEIRGSVSVDEAILYVDEFARNVSVVDFMDLGTDTTEFFRQSLIRDIRNPFLENLRVEVDLSVPRNTWLRSNEMNVEMGGEQLIVTYDRRESDLVLIGDLQALRGSYSVLGRSFEVSEGTVSFLGTPGINPILNIQALSRIRRIEDEPLEVVANVEGTLTLPRVALSTDEAGLVQSDLISYLIFGRASSELATGQTAFLQGAVGSFATTLVSGAVATQLGAALAQGIGIDYLSITQAGDFMLAGGVTNSLADTQVEIGQYVGPDTFIVLVFRPLSGQDTGASIFGGARLEYAFSDDYVVQGFFEDRFLRSGSAGLGSLGIPQAQVVGVFIFREWGY